MEAPVTEEKKDIIIKCPLKDMVKRFFKDYVVVWHDPALNSQENQKYMVHFVERFCEIKTFTEWEKASIYIRGTKKICHIITSGTNGELLIREICSHENVCNIYVFCINKDYHSNWTRNYPKISCVETQIERILDQIQQSLLEWYKQSSSLTLNLPAFAPIFNDTHKSQMNHLHRFLKFMPNFKNREQAKNDFIALSREIYSDKRNTNFITDFEQNYNGYNMREILNWYTLQSFLYKVTNNCLRIATSDSIQYCRLILKDIQSAIKEQYQIKSKDFNGLLYRAAYLSEEEWSSLKENVGQEIEMHGFLSVSKEKDAAERFMGINPSTKVFITIIAPKGSNEEEQGFAEVEEFSAFPQEKEVLFNVRSRFTILETEEKYSEKLPSRHLVLLYGAQGFRRFLAEKNPVQELSVPENISCAQCKAQNSGSSKKMLFIPLVNLTKSNYYYCKGCLPNLTGSQADSLLCVPIINDLDCKKVTAHKIKVKGCLLAKAESKIPFYGYQCTECQARKKESYFVCTNCNKGRNKWCNNCFENKSDCIKLGHVIILESSPFSFWCEEMSTRELNHLEIQSNSVSKDDDFEQAEMYFRSHEDEKAIEYYKIYIHANKGKERDENLALCYSNLGLIYDGREEYEKALKYYFKSLEITKKFHGDDHLNAALSYNNIGATYHNLKEDEKALEYYLKSLNIRKSFYGENHPDVADSYHNIASIYHSQQKEFKKALEYYSKSLNIKILIHGINHPDIAIYFHNLGMINYDLAKHKEALEYLLKSLEIRNSVYGENHPDVANSYSSIAKVYCDQGEFEKAFKCSLKSLNIRESIYGINHPDVIHAYNRVGMILSSQGEYQKAREFFLKSLERRKRIHGENHPDVADSYNNIASVYHRQQEYETALEYSLKCLDIRKSTSGINPSLIAQSYNNIGMVYQDQQEYEKALEYHFKSLSIQKSLDEDHHIDVSDTYDKIANAYRHQEEYKKALDYDFKSLAIKQSIYGSNHPVVADSYNNMGVTFKDQGNLKKALEYHLKSLAIRKLVYGDNHPHLAASYNNIGSVYQDQEEYEKALESFFKSLEIRKTVYGDNHAQVAETYNNMAGIFTKQEEYIKAWEYQLKSFDIISLFYGKNHPRTRSILMNLMIVKVLGEHAEIDYNFDFDFDSDFDFDFELDV